jgi:anthranilate synthase/aminodeoxychorismate synthase-like glutamine amidotransferase
MRYRAIMQNIIPCKINSRKPDLTESSGHRFAVGDVQHREKANTAARQSRNRKRLISGGSVFHLYNFYRSLSFGTYLWPGASFSVKLCLEALGSSMVFVLDNYDSFTYNLVQYLGELGQQVEVRRNDQVTPQDVEAMRPDHILVSPGPCTPQMAGISIDLIKHFAGKRPVLGVCLGHQAIGAAFGGNVIRAKKLMHGKTSQIQHDGKTLFQNMPLPMTATRYHSLIVAEEDLPKELEISAETREDDGTRVIMGLRHRHFPVEGVQFHPESVLTDSGRLLLKNFLAL